MCPLFLDLKTLVSAGAMCHLELNHFTEAVNWCDEGLQIDAKEKKLLEVRAKADKLKVGDCLQIPQIVSQVTVGVSGVCASCLVVVSDSTLPRAGCKWGFQQAELAERLLGSVTLREKNIPGKSPRRDTSANLSLNTTLPLLKYITQVPDISQSKV